MFPVLTVPLPAKSSNDGRKRCPSLIAAALSRSHTASQCGNKGATTLAELLEVPMDAVLLLDAQLWEAFQPSAKALLELMPDHKSVVIVLVSRQPAPVPQFRPDGPVFSFISSPEVLQQAMANQPDVDPGDLCFELLRQILNGTIQNVDRVLVRQIPEEPVHRDVTPPKLPVALIMAHRGPHRYLDTALRYLSRADGAARQVRVGLDVDDPDDYRTVMQRHPEAEFFRVTPAPMGPYVIRQELAIRSPEPLLALQDSDDLSCYDRFTSLRSEMATTGCDMIGSHELRVDEVQRQIVAIRFPLDATAALQERNCFALLHGTLMIKRKVFFSAGGLSTDQMVANDTQFLMRAFFHARIRNVDEFLYLRRRHRRALTIAPETAAGNELRLRLDANWTEDFEAVKRGEIKLEESSLRPMKATMDYRIEPLLLDFVRNPFN